MADWRMAQEIIRELKDGTIEITHSEQQRENRLRNKNKESLSDLWDYNKRCNIHVTESQKKERMKQG